MTTKKLNKLTMALAVEDVCNGNAVILPIKARPASFEAMLAKILSIHAVLPACVNFPM